MKTRKKNFGVAGFFLPAINATVFNITYDTIAAFDRPVTLMSHFGSSEGKTKFALIRIDLSIKTWVY